ncbi:Hpr(Ser) kinase/phosphatase [Pseudoduganella flava]|uniref:Hpr(Ser) kinase/phosphatase n=1 Tax=Pseudoduganella flava TaxID=871742 RepID=A0A562PNK3_9BURK|nr:HprK-related kinase A [Pseudoduganella flava]QGZ40589.1 HprK-related kinase A [Pseudoduganella flava]TWI46035.1 Hpr(Ser) kinase/phosphatase [Pseudoduganella flava]
MATVASLTRAELGERLAGPGINLGTGRFTTRLRSPIAGVADGIHLLYGAYPLCDNDRFADFHLELVRPATPRRWLRPQVTLLYDGRSMFKPLPLDQAFPMFEWGLNWCVSSRANRYLIVHAAVVEKGGCAAILPAPPGSGKSTLCAALVGRGGWRLLSDELTLLRLDDGLLHPLPRPISLKNASIGVIRDYVPDSVMSRPVTDTVKGTVAHLRAPAASVARAGESALPGWVVFPRFEAGATLAADPLPRADTFMQLAQNCFNYSLLGAEGFTALAGLVERSAGWRFRYGLLDDALAFFDSLP